MKYACHVCNTHLIMNDFYKKFSGVDEFKCAFCKNKTCHLYIRKNKIVDFIFTNKENLYCIWTTAHNPRTIILQEGSLKYEVPYLELTFTSNNAPDVDKLYNQIKLFKAFL